MPDWVVAACGWICVKEVLRVARPESLVELEEDLGVGAHAEVLDCGAFPVGELGGEGYGVVLEDAQ